MSIPDLCRPMFRHPQQGFCVPLRSGLIEPIVWHNSIWYESWYTRRFTESVMVGQHLPSLKSEAPNLPSQLGSYPNAPT